MLHGKCYYTKGLISMQEEKYKKAKKQFKIDLQICKQMKDEYGELNTRIMLAKVDYSLG